MKRKPRILIVDSQPMMRYGIRHMLHGFVEVVGEADNGRDAVHGTSELKPDIVIMSIHLTGLTGIEAASRIIQWCPSARVILYSREEGDEYTWQAIKIGVSGYVTKKGPVGELRDAIKEVLSGCMYLSPSIRARVANKFPLRQVDSPIEQLTGRQREVLQLIGEGQNTKAIALVLGIDSKTVEYHRAELYKKLNTWDIPGLIRASIKYGLVEV